MLPGTIFAPKSRIMCLHERVVRGSPASAALAARAARLPRCGAPGCRSRAPTSTRESHRVARRSASAACSFSRLRRLVERLALDAQQPLVGVARHQLRLQGQFARQRA